MILHTSVTFLIIVNVLFTSADNETGVITDDDIHTEIDKLDLNNDELELLKTILHMKGENPAKTISKSEENGEINDESESSETSEDNINSDIEDKTAEDLEESTEINVRIDLDKHEVNINNDNAFHEDKSEESLPDLIERSVDVAQHNPDIVLDYKARSGSEEDDSNHGHFEINESVIPLQYLHPSRRTLGGPYPQMNPQINPFSNLFNNNPYSTSSLSREVSLPDIKGTNTYPYSPYTFEGYIRPMAGSQNYIKPINYNPFFIPNRDMGGFLNTPYRLQ